MNKTLLFVASFVLLGGCATQPIAINSSAKEIYETTFQTVELDDYAMRNTTNEGRTYYVNGWVRTAIVVKPELHEALTAILRDSLRPVGDSGTISIAVLDTGLFIKKTYADDLAFVNLLIMGRNRGFKCTATVI